MYSWGKENKEYKTEPQHTKQKEELKRCKQTPNRLDKTSNQEERGRPENQVRPENKVETANSVGQPINIYIYIYIFVLLLLSASQFTSFPMIDYDENDNKCLCAAHPCWDDDGKHHSCNSEEAPHLKFSYTQDQTLTWQKTPQ